MSLDNIRDNHFANNVFATTNRFGETVTIKDAAEPTPNSYSVTAVVRRRHEIRVSDQGHFESVEIATVVIDKNELPGKPGMNWTLHLTGESKSYQYAFEGNTSSRVYTLVFEATSYVVS